MADASVKNMLKHFEQTDNMSSGRGNKPEIPKSKPVMQRFQALQENAAAGISTDPKPSWKSGQPVIKLEGLGERKPLRKTSTDDTNINEGNEKKQVDVPKVFQNGQASGANDSNNNNKNNSSITKSIGGSPFFSNNNPQVMPKFPSMSVSKLKPSIAPKSSAISSSNSGEDSIKKLEQSSTKTALVPKNAHSKSDSISSTSSCSSTSSSNQNTTNTLSLSPNPNTTSSSNTSSSSSQINGTFDLKSQLRKVNHSSSGPPIKRVLSNNSSGGSDSSTELPPPKCPSSPSPASAESSIASTGKSNSSSARIPPIPTTDDILLRSKKVADEIIERKSDRKKFRKLELPSQTSATAPEKPTVPSNIDLTLIREDFRLQKLMNTSPSSSSSTQPGPEKPETEVDDDDLYWDSESQQTSGQPRLPEKPASESSRASQRISMIPEMSLEEEEGLDLPVYDDTPPIDEEEYADAMSQITPRPKASSVSSEATVSEQEKKKRLKEEANAKKQEEKERKEKEKKEKEEEKKRKKKEEEELKLRAKFNLTGNEKIVGQGKIKQDAKSSGLNLKVKKDQIITIVRLDANPKNKWLVKTDTQMGYVDSQNIEVDANIIRQTMTGHGGDAEEDMDQPTYDCVPEELLTTAEPIPEDDEDIYEVCP